MFVSREYDPDVNITGVCLLLPQKVVDPSLDVGAQPRLAVNRLSFLLVPAVVLEHVRLVGQVQPAVSTTRTFTAIYFSFR